MTIESTCAISIVIACVVLNVLNCSAQTNKPLSPTIKRQADERSGAIVIEATLQNVSANDVTLNSQDSIVDYTLVVTNERGVAVPFSKRGEKLFSKDRIRSTRSIEVKLAPNEIRRDTLGLGDIYKFAVPGRYFITATRQFWTATSSETSSKDTYTEGSVSSNTLDVSVK